MSTINNKNATERIVHTKFHQLAEKYNIEVDTIANIITDWEDSRDKINKRIRIRNLRYKNYTKVIEVRVPVRFYWYEEDYDGFEFGSLEDCSKYQIKLLNEVIKQLLFEHDCAHDCAIVGEFMREHHKEEWRKIIDMIDEETKTLDIPKSFLDAFKTNNK